MKHHAGADVLGVIMSSFLFHIVVVILSVHETKAKDISGHITTDETWHYLDTFCVDGNADEAVRLNFEVEYIMRYYSHVQEILIYNDKDWSRLTDSNCSQRQSLLDQKHQIALTKTNTSSDCDRIDPKIPGVRTMVCKGSRQLSATDDAKWYIATSNCDAAIPGVEMWYRISITYKGGGNADFCYNQLRTRLLAVAITLAVLLVLLYIAIAILYFTKWRRKKPKEATTTTTATSSTGNAQNYSVKVEQRTPLQSRASGPPSAHSNYGYVSDTMPEASAVPPPPFAQHMDNGHPADYQPQDYSDPQGAVYFAADSNSIPIRYPNPLTTHDSFSQESGSGATASTSSNSHYSKDYASHNGIYPPIRANGDIIQAPRPPSVASSTHHLWHNPSFVLDDAPDEPKYQLEEELDYNNTDDYQRFLWNKMRASPQTSNCTDNTYDEIGNQQGYNNSQHRKYDSFRLPALSEV